MTKVTPATCERRVYLRGVALPLSVAEALIADARLSGDGIAEALERALRDGRFAGRPGEPRRRHQPSADVGR
ncbi:MAG TPA: hypothetical protein VKR30_04795 [Candidatus Limnocylindrales bacterium]|nr:hypothetical protein [Candidatus Limnocylindrales bacterium]